MSDFSSILSPHGFYSLTIGGVDPMLNDGMSSPLRLAGGREVVRVADGLGDLLGHDGFHEVGGVDPLQLSR